MTDDCEESNLERHSIKQSATDVMKNENRHDDMDDLSEHIVSSFSTAGFTGQMLVDEVFKGFLAKKMEDIESEHQKVHKSKKKKSKDNESSKSRKHKHKKKHKNKSTHKDRDHKVDLSDIDKKERRCDHSRSDAELSRTDREHSEQSSQIDLKKDKICENECNLQRDKHTRSKNYDKITFGNNIKGEIIEGPAVEEYEKKERKCAVMVDTDISGEIADCQMSNFVEGEDRETSSKNNCKSDLTDLKEDLSQISVHDRKLPKSFQDHSASGNIKSCDDLGASCFDTKLVTGKSSSERNIGHGNKIVSEDIENRTLLCAKNEEESSLSGKDINVDNKNLSELKKDHSLDSSLDLVSIHGEDKGRCVDHQSFGPECPKVEQQDVLRTTEVVDLCQSDSSNFVGESDVLGSCHVKKSDNYSKETETCKKKESDHRSSEKRSDVYKDKRHSHKKHDRESLDSDKKSKHRGGSTSNNCRGHSRDRSTDRHPSSAKIGTASSRTREETKSRDTKCQSKERQRTRSTKSRSAERRHDSGRKSYERSSDTRHKSKKQRHKPTREKSVEIIEEEEEEEEAESADASEKLTERLLRRLNTSIKKGQELRAEKRSLLEPHTAPQSVDGTKPPVLCSQTDADLVIPKTEDRTPSEPIVLASESDLPCASAPDPCPVLPDNIPVATVRNESVVAATVKPTLSKVKKKPAMKMGIRLTETSVAIISSGIRFESELKAVSGGKGDENGGSESNANEPHQGSILSNSEDLVNANHPMILSVIADEAKETAICSKQDSITAGLDANEKKSKKRKRSRSRSKSRGREDKKRRRERSVEKGRRSARNRSKDRHRRSNSRPEDGNRKLRSQSRGRGHRSRSTSKDRSRKAKIQSRNRDRRSRSRDHRSPADRKRTRSKSVEPKKPVPDLRLKIDKAKLREIAIKNVYGNLQSGSRQLGDLKPDAVAALKAGGKSVEELTDFCKRIAEKEKDQSADSPLDDDKESTEDEEDKPFTANTFKARDLASSIVLNIRNSKPLPILTSQEKIAKAAELRTQFPVSSGSQHRAKEWVPVEKPKAGESAETSNKKDDEKVFPDPPSEQIDVGHIVSERLSALRKLQSNPGDVQALGCVYKSQQKMQEWAASKQLPGLFVGSTGVNVLSQKELMGNNPKNQAWVKKVSS